MMNRNMKNSTIAAMCLGAALSTTSVWGDEQVFDCTIDETQAIEVDCISREGSTEWILEDGAQSQLILEFLQITGTQYVGLGLGQNGDVQIGNYVINLTINCLTVEGQGVINLAGNQCNISLTQIETVITDPTSTGTRARRYFRARFRRSNGRSLRFR